VNFKFSTSSKVFTIHPTEGSVLPNDKSLSIAVLFKSMQEIDIKNSSEIVCQLNDTHSGQLISKISVNANAKAAFTKYSITPEKALNFTPFEQGTKKIRQFSIQNEGEFEFK
jgi:hypothetical protein